VEAAGIKDGASSSVHFLERSDRSSPGVISTIGLCVTVDRLGDASDSVVNERQVTFVLSIQFSDAKCSTR
jgi:hypothetical protein